jgi:hypothetical protein
MTVVKLFESDYCTVFRGESEVLVYGSGSDWIVRYANATNGSAGWSEWFGYRGNAEIAAEALASKPFTAQPFAGRSKKARITKKASQSSLTGFSYFTACGLYSFELVLAALYAFS